MMDSLKNFRFESLTIWQDSIIIADKMFDIAEKLTNERLFRFTEQLRGAALSISNNIAEGSGSFSNKDFANYLVIARKSIFECANMLIIFERRNLIDHKTRSELFSALLILSSQITNFRKTLLKKTNK
ncbi:MAG: four helix bundle protein [Bacteroidales bacterium]|nr:four helix bundle protein [Bacteroidales bacterium]